MHNSGPSIGISYIILTWNSESYLQRCFDSIVNKSFDEGVGFEIIVVDNGSTDRSCDIVRQFIQKYPDSFHLISLDQNSGTTYPRNLGIKKSTKDYICILDSDTELGEGRLTAVIERLQSDTNIGIIAPRLLLPDCSVQNSVKRFPTMLNKLMKIPRILFGIKTRNFDFYDEFPFNTECQIDSAISACWFFSRDLTDVAGYLDEDIFYSPEDIDYSLRVWKAGKCLLYFPGFTVLHHTQQITHKKPLSKTSLSHFFGLIYYYRKHGGWLFRPSFKSVKKVSV